MRISFDAPEEWEALLKEEAKKDGHSNCTAVIRKIVNLFFKEKLAFSCHSPQATEENK